VLGQVGVRPRWRVPVERVPGARKTLPGSEKNRGVDSQDRSHHLMDVVPLAAGYRDRRTGLRGFRRRRRGGKSIATPVTRTLTRCFKDARSVSRLLSATVVRTDDGGAS
jgi:hypothetical protein